MNRPLQISPGTDSLTDELFALVQADQGFAFISDDDAKIPDEEVLNRARGALYYTERVARKLRKFIKKHERPDVK